LKCTRESEWNCSLKNYKGQHNVNFSENNFFHKQEFEAITVQISSLLIGQKDLVTKPMTFWILELTQIDIKSILPTEYLMCCVIIQNKPNHQQTKGAEQC
jgi:hypothetical protein